MAKIYWSLALLLFALVIYYYLPECKLPASKQEKMNLWLLFKICKSLVMDSTPFDLLKFHATLKSADNKVIEKYKDIFPKFVIEEWRNRGFSSYLKGLLITTNPEDYYGILEGWVDEPAKCHVIMRTAFGSLYYLKGKEYYDISVIHDLSSHLQNDFEIIIEFSLTKKVNQKDILHKDIYDKAYKRLGSPNYDEVYAFVPAIPLGGDYNPDNIEKVKLKEHLAFLQQLR